MHVTSSESRKALVLVMKRYLEALFDVEGRRKWKGDKKKKNKYRKHCKKKKKELSRRATSPSSGEI